MFWKSRLDDKNLVTPANRLNYSLRELLGVVSAIVPWNFPLMNTMWKLAAAFTVGNILVIKLAEQTSVSILE